MTAEPFVSNPSRESTTEPLQALLRRGEEAACAGRLEEARRHFETILQISPEHVEALLWLAWLAGGGRPSLTYLVRVLKVDPTNQKAREAIRWARKRAAATPAAEPPAPAGRPGCGHDGTVSRVRPVRSQRVAWRWRYALGGIAALALVLLAGLSTTAFDGHGRDRATPVARLAPSVTATGALTAAVTVASRPTATLPPTWTANPSLTATLPPSLTPSPTATATSTPGPTPTETALPTLPIGDSFRWIDVDLTHQRLTAYEGETQVHEVVVSTGLPRTPTVTGRFRIYVKYPLTRMRGPDYDLPNVPWVMYFYSSYGIHGTYWHTNFGQPASHGCINLPRDEAEWLYNWAEVGTLVNIHY